MDKNTYRSVPVKPEEITPEHVYLNRRQFMKGIAALGVGALLAACAGGSEQPESTQPAAPEEAPDTGMQEPAAPEEAPEASSTTDELGDPLNTYEEITNYNNYYEFTTVKQEVAPLAQEFKTAPWQVEIYGLVNRPLTLSIEDILGKFTLEERIYRLRCVEAWSMVIPWQGFPLSELLKEVEPTDAARYVRFETVMRPEEMPGQRYKSYPWPYQEGLRLDEAMHNLTILATGLYGKPMPAQNGAPIRLVVPWKYGFKSIKGIVKIELVAEEPSTLWSDIAPDEYGFYANVNPEVNHPRWSQGTERRIGEMRRRSTMMFNGYTAEVASLYDGMDLRHFY